MCVLRRAPRGVHTSVTALEQDIRTWIDGWNENPKPFSWTKTADQILNSLADYLTKINPQTTKPEKDLVSSFLAQRTLAEIEHSGGHRPVPHGRRPPRGHPRAGRLRP